MKYWVHAGPDSWCSSKHFSRSTTLRTTSTRSRATTTLLPNSRSRNFRKPSLSSPRNIFSNLIARIKSSGNWKINLMEKSSSNSSKSKKMMTRWSKKTLLSLSSTISLWPMQQRRSDHKTSPARPWPKVAPTQIYSAPKFLTAIRRSEKKLSKANLARLNSECRYPSSVFSAKDVNRCLLMCLILL
jgi:hypothetical protein